MVNVSLADPVQSPPSLLLLVLAVSRASRLPDPLYVCLSVCFCLWRLPSCRCPLPLQHHPRSPNSGTNITLASLDAHCYRIRWICRVHPALPAWEKAAAASGCSDSAGRRGRRRRKRRRRQKTTRKRCWTWMLTTTTQGCLLEIPPLWLPLPRRFECLL